MQCPLSATKVLCDARSTELRGAGTGSEQSTADAGVALSFLCPCYDSSGTDTAYHATSTDIPAPF
eukprot:1245986-Rhodomonas_salina.3